MGWDGGSAGLFKWHDEGTLTLFDADRQVHRCMLSTLHVIPQCFACMKASCPFGELGLGIL